METKIAALKLTVGLPIFFLVEIPTDLNPAAYVHGISVKSCRYERVRPRKPIRPAVLRKKCRAARKASAHIARTRFDGNRANLLRDFLANGYSVQQAVVTTPYALRPGGEREQWPGMLQIELAYNVPSRIGDEVVAWLLQAVSANQRTTNIFTDATDISIEAF